MVVISREVRKLSTRRDKRNRPENRFPVKPAATSAKTRIVGTRMTEGMRKLAYVLRRRNRLPSIPALIRLLIEREGDAQLAAMRASSDPIDRESS